MSHLTWEKNYTLLAATGLQIYFLPFNDFLLNTSVCHQCFAVQRLLVKNCELFPSLTAGVRAKKHSQLSPGSTSPQQAGRQLSSPTACLDNKQGCSLTSAGGSVPGCLAVLCQVALRYILFSGKAPGRGHSPHPC